MPPSLLLLGDLLNEDILRFSSIFLVKSLAKLTDVIFKLNRLLGISRFDRGALDTWDINRDYENKNSYQFLGLCLLKQLPEVTAMIPEMDV